MTFLKFSNNSVGGQMEMEHSAVYTQGMTLKSSVCVRIRGVREEAGGDLNSRARDKENKCKGETGVVGLAAL